MSQKCPERIQLGKAVADAIAKVYRAKDAYNTAKQNRSAETEVLAAILMQALDAERIAAKALDAHMKEHGCKQGLM